METVSIVLQELMVKFLTLLPKAIAAMVILALSFYLAGVLSKVLNKALEKRNVDHEIKLVLCKITRWSAIVLGFFIALQQLGFDLSAFLVSLGVVGFTIGFALQDISKNLVAGMLLLLQQPFDIGNAIEVAGYSGTVMDVNLRATEIRTFDGKTVLIPNGDVYTSAITNYSRAISRRLEVNVGVAYGTDLEVARTTALNAIASVHGVHEDPAPQVVFNNFGNSSIDFTLYFWVDTEENGILEARDAAVVAVNSAFEAKKIEIPYPIQTVLMRQ